MRAYWGAVAGLVVVAGCASGGTESAPTEEPSSSSPAAATSASADAADAIQLLYISDSSGWQTGEAYAALAEAELGAPVELVDWRIPNLSMVYALDLIADKPDVVGNAEIVVVWANAMDSGVKPGWLACFLMSGEPEVYTEADWAPFAEAAGRVLDAIWEARDGEPTVLRVTDIYAPVVAEWEELGMREACLAQSDPDPRVGVVEGPDW